MKNFIYCLILPVFLFSCSAEDVGTGIGILAGSNGSNRPSSNSGNYGTNNNGNASSNVDLTLADGFEEIAEESQLTGFLVDEKKLLVQSSNYGTPGIFTMSLTGEKTKFSNQNMAVCGAQPSYYFNNNIMYWHRSNYEFAANVETGEELFAQPLFDGSTGVIGGTSFELYHAAYEPHKTLPNTCQAVVYRKSITLGATLKTFIPKVIGEEVKGGSVAEIFAIEIYQNELGGKYLLICYGDANADLGHDYFMSLYDLDNNQWLYERKPGVHLRWSAQPKIAGGRIFVSNTSGLYAFDLLSGELIWEVNESTFRNLVILDQQLIYGDIDNKKLVCVDVATGSTIWTSNLEGCVNAVGSIVILGNRVYVQSGELQIHDLETGELLRAFDHPYIESNRHFFNSGSPIYGYFDETSSENVILFNGDYRIFTFKETM